MRDAQRFDDFYRGTRARLVAYLFAVGGDLAEAQDAAQEAYTRAWQHWSSLAGSTDPEAWVRTVGWRVLAHRWRSLRSRRRAQYRQGTPRSSPAPSEDTVILVAALRQLPESQRHALVLYHLLDLPVVRIAAAILGNQMEEVDHA